MPNPASPSRSNPSTAAERLQSLRTLMRERGASGVVVPISDEHMSEYVPEHAQRLRWLTGFRGSAATAVVLEDAAAIFTDGRYVEQVGREVDSALYDCLLSPRHDFSDWLNRHAPDGSTVLFDPWLHSQVWLSAMQSRLQRGVLLRPCTSNLVDALWTDRPEMSAAAVAPHPLQYAGQSSQAKREAIAQAMRQQGLDATVITALDSVAWLFNIRGSDVAHTPVVRAFALLHADATATLFVDRAKSSPELLSHLGPGVSMLDYEALVASLAALARKRVSASPSGCSVAIFDALKLAEIVWQRDPCERPRAAKNEAEIIGMRQAHRRDGVALVRFYHWLEEAVAAGTVTEIEASEKLLALRAEAPEFRDLSFPTISAAGPSGAFAHYCAKPGQERSLARGELYLLDSGAQYPDGTTDVTRTVAIGEPSEEMRLRFTEVLKGHIAIACCRLPPGTTGGQVDALARQFLWQSGIDYATGTGHGVGSFLSVHEGPVFIGRDGGTRPVDEPFIGGLVISNEPGYYKHGHYGIRTENLYLTVACQGQDGREGWLAFEPLTLVPIDRRLIRSEELSRRERSWIDNYHRSVFGQLAPLLPTATARWLEQACRPL
ncbi:aminopeptidase P family protein [Roseateles violae]|uniref:Aminopeptidase P family protein n=1 Tax=Roseateles violae TaxID=3058042 RepID=A0ABT8E024_9BURK|nr:aminopeptidase P family protein [Pelomonas sp. PFR6]MDN3923201.1 aminopeptidase P family protein [Pelomonas sp. PFR6]